MISIGWQRKLFSTGMGFVLLVSLMLTACVPESSSDAQSMTLKFEAVVGSQALAFNRIQYDNPGGEGQFKVRDFQFILSNIKLRSDTGIYLQPDSYHIVRFDNADTSFTLVLDNIPAGDYREIDFSIGVDPDANSSRRSVGDLDPNSRMAWSWDVGYKFILFEGGLNHHYVLSPLVYHVGFSENYRTLRFPLSNLTDNNKNSAKPLARLIFRVDLMSLFKGVNTIDMVALSSVKFDKGDAKLIAENFQGMITLCQRGVC